MTSLLSPLGREFVTERHLATLSTFAKDESLHVVPVGFTVDGDLARVIASGTSQKVLNIRRDGRATICQVEGRNWVTLIGTAEILEEQDDVARAVELYSQRYKAPRENPLRVAIALRITKMMGSPGMLAG
ncbi:PPOX class F420-dependent oxidoreductase [Glaciihabitans arcticus]|uniref:PPOX class F420-dependent oxidoreductase n=1 Tax=Glaciihabitans arcticus TaxID=2668039 RepID=A0A4V2JF01_9MICO|nr:PPOX class F420-dependent oxidoreductase [Glaciihabitans arcticus]TBN57559.1 PPOX class F420-dependent oxidoreductase [Glaciihabitans arcticus]